MLSGTTKMAASYVATLGDEELRQCLRKYGESIGPITESTREIYKKRLAKILASDRNFSKSLISNVPNTKTPDPWKPSRSKTPIAAVTVNEKETDSATGETTISGRRRSSRLSKKNTSTLIDTSHTVNDEDSDIENVSYGRLNKSRDYGQNNIRAEASLRKRAANYPLSEKLGTKFMPNDRDVYDNSQDEFYFESSDNEEVNDSNVVVDKLSSFRRGLTNLKKQYFSKRGKELPSKPDSNSVHHASCHTKDSNLSKEWPQSMWQQLSSYLYRHISAILVIVTLVFFIVLWLIYLNILTKENLVILLNGLQRLSKGKSFRDHDNLLVCGTKAYLTNDAGCLSVEEAEKAVDVVNVVHDILSVNAGDYECGYPASGKNLTVQHVRSRIQERLSASKYSDNIWLTALRMIAANQHWNIRLYSHDGRQITDEAFPSQVNLVHHMDTTVVKMSLPCRFKKFMEDLAWKTSVLAMVFLTGYFIYTLWKTYRRTKEEEMAAVYCMVEKVIDILQKNYQAYTETKAKYPYVAILHIRDKLVKPSQRKSELVIWEKVVKFLEANESRIRTEIQDVDGEQFNVWRWLPAYNDDGQVPRVWQGNALLNGANTKNFVSPTACLKIRNMFDLSSISEEDWTDSVEEAIVEKCHGHCKMVHVGADVNSTEGVVYVKCASKQDAGAAFRELHGWWFAGRLVTAKFIKEERYLEHFPVARHCTQTLAPSDSKLSSVAGRYYKSALEM